VNDRQQAIIKTSNNIIDEMTTDIYLLFEKVETLSHKMTEKERTIYYLIDNMQSDHILIQSLQKELDVYR